MIKTALLIPDCHIPFHDKKSYEIMLLAAQDVYRSRGIDTIYIMGDYLDFFWFSLHPKMPEMMSVRETLKDEIYQGIAHLKQLRELFPKSKIVFIEGNHEYRMIRYIVRKCPELFDLFTVPEILKLDEMGIEYVPFGKNQLVQCLNTDYYLRHQPYSSADYCAGGTAKKKHISLGFGHTHRKQSYDCTDAHGQEISCHSLGWLGDRGSPVFTYIDCDHWTQGFQFVTDVNGRAYKETVEIRNHQAVFMGNLYEGA